MTPRVLVFLAASLLAPCVALPLDSGTAHAQSADEILARFDTEPTVLEVQAAALDYAGLDPGAIGGWYTRASIANLLPERAQYRFRMRGIDREYDRFTEDLNAESALLGADRRRETRTDEDQSHEVTVSWDFSDLIFNPDVLRVAAEASRQVKQRDSVLTTVTKLYYERRRAQIDLILRPPSDAADRLRAELRIQELTADLDAYTGAWFSQRLIATGKNPY